MKHKVRVVLPQEMIDLMETVGTVADDGNGGYAYHLPYWFYPTDKDGVFEMSLDAPKWIKDEQK